MFYDRKAKKFEARRREVSNLDKGRKVVSQGSRVLFSRAIERISGFTKYQVKFWLSCKPRWTEPCLITIFA